MIEGIVMPAAIATAGVIGIGIFGYKKISTVSPYLYANARIQARPSRLIGKVSPDELASKKDLRSLIHSLEGTDYLTGLEASGLNARNLHLHLEKHLAITIEEIKGFSPKNFLPLLESYSLFYTVRVLKSLYRSRYLETKVEVSEDILFPVGDIDKLLLERLKETKTVQDIATVLSDTRYKDIFSREYESLEEFEVEIDSFILDNFNKNIKKSRLPNKKAIIDIVNTKFDVINLTNILKCIVRDTSPEWREELIVENDSVLGKMIKNLSKTKDIQSFVSGLIETEYHETVKNAMDDYKKDGYLAHFEVALWRHFKEKLLNRELYFQLGPFPLISYLIKKELEVKNLMAASKGVESGLKQQEITEVMV